jgi:hypothetical protein
MRSIKIAVSLSALLLALGLTFVVETNAQEPTAEPREEEPSGEIDGLGLKDPPPTGFSVLYMFTGVANDNTPPNNNRATVVHCTNFGSTATTLGIEFFLSTGGGTPNSPYINTLAANQTRTYSTQSTFFGGEVPLDSGVIEQGSGRVLFKEHSNVICTAQVLQPGNDITPTFMVKLPLFDSNGNPIGGGGPVFLPVILKQ